MFGSLKKIAICIPTYNRAKILYDTYSKIITIIDNKLFDIYIYDSSVDNIIETEIKKLNQGNLFYYKIDPSVHSSRKLYDIFRNKSIQDNYEYLWILPDYLFFSEKVIDNLIEKSDEDWDMIMLDFYDPEGRGNRQYSDPNEIFSEYSWSLTQYGILVIKCETVLKNVDWKYLECKYLNENCKNFSHVAMYFEVMYQMLEIKFYHFSIPRKDVYVSKYKSETSDYLDDFLCVWGYCWYNTLIKLPEFYRDKKEVIKKACIYTKCLGKRNLARLKIDGVLTLTQFWRYKRIWKYISTVNPLIVLGIIVMPAWTTKYIAEYGGIKEWILTIIMAARLKKFCSKHNIVYLYGAGMKGKRLADFMEKKEIPFEGFVVTNIDSDIRYLKGHKINEIREIVKTDNVGIILALNNQNRQEVVPLLYEMGYRDLFQYDFI